MTHSACVCWVNSNNQGQQAMAKYDLIVIGSGPAGRRAARSRPPSWASACWWSRSGRRVGGVSVHTGTIPSKTLRETVLNLSGWRERGFYGRAYRVKQDIAGEGPAHAPAHDARPRGRGAGAPVRPQRRATPSQGAADFLDPHRIEVTTDDDERHDHRHRRTRPDRRRHRPYRPAHIPSTASTSSTATRSSNSPASAAQPDRGRRRRHRHRIRHDLLARSTCR